MAIFSLEPSVDFPITHWALAGVKNTMISANSQLFNIAVTTASQSAVPECYALGRFRAFLVSSRSDHGSILSEEKKYDKKRKKIQSFLSISCLTQSSVRIDKTQLLAQLSFDGGDQSSEKAALSKRLLRRAINDYFGSLPWRKSLLPGREPCERAFLLPTMLAASVLGSRLHRKAASNNLRELEAAIRHAGADINCQSSKSGKTPLLWAAINRHWALALTLLEAGACVHLRGHRGQHFLQQVFIASRAKEISTAQYQLLIYHVLLRQAELKLVTGQREETVFAYVWKHIVAQADVSLFDYLIKSMPFAIDQLKKHQVGERMMGAVIAGLSDQPEVISYLMGLSGNAGNQLVDMNHTFDNGDTFLMLAVQCHKRQTVKVLLEDPLVVKNINYVNERRDFNSCAYALACQDFSFTLMRMLEAKGATRSQSAIVSGVRVRDCTVCDSRQVRRNTGHTTYYRVPITVMADAPFSQRATSPAHDEG